LSESGKYPSDEQIRSWESEWRLNRELKFSMSDFVTRRVCEWQRERGAEICDGMTMSKDAEVTEALEAAADRIRNSL